MAPDEYFIKLGKSIAGPAKRERIEALWKAGKLAETAEVSPDKIHWETVKEFLQAGAEESSTVPTEKRADGPPGKKKKKQSKRGKGKGLYPHWMIPSFLDNSAIAAPLTLQEAIDLRDGVGFLRIALICVVTIFGAFIAPIFFILYMLKFIKVRLYKPMVLTHGICLAISLFGGCCFFPALFFITSDDNPRNASILPLVIQIASTLFGFVLSMAYVYFISGYLHGLSNNVSCPKVAKKFTESFNRFCFALAIPVFYSIIYIIMFVLLKIINPTYETSKPYFFIISLSGMCLLIFIYFLISIFNFFSGLSLLSSNLDDYIDECPEPEDDLGSETV
ncbi:MAG: hypothetical protein WCO91_08115 [Gemmataceae bacterium]